MAAMSLYLSFSAKPARGASMRKRPARQSISPRTRPPGRRCWPSRARNSSTSPGRCRAFASANEIAQETGGGAPYRIVVVSRRGGRGHDDIGTAACHPADRARNRQSADRHADRTGRRRRSRRAQGGADRSLGSAARRHPSAASPRCAPAPFCLAEAGLLAGRRATTHWKSQPVCSSNIRTSRSIPIRSISATGEFGHRPASPPASISASL